MHAIINIVLLIVIFGNLLLIPVLFAVGVNMEVHNELRKTYKQVETVEEIQ